jgi:arylsulfatase A-like enzyme
MSTKPNVLFFFTDDQRFDTIAALGHDTIKTPNLDKLVARGTTFTHAHIPSGTSGAVCMPSRAMLNTGRTLYHLEGAGGSIPDDHTLIGEMFQQNGYRTFGTGKWHNGKKAYARSFTDGDEIFFGGMSDHWNVPAYHFDPDGVYDSTVRRCPTPLTSKKEETIHCDHIEIGKHSSELFADATINFIDNVGDAPFYAYMSFMAPHDPRVMPDRFKAMYNPETIALPPNFSGGHPFPIGCTKIRDEILAEFPRDPAEVKEHISEYYGIITHLDYELGRVMDALEAAGKLENTIIVFAGDNGLAVGQHGLMGKQSCYEHSIRVPLIFAGPAIPEGLKTDAYVYLLDIFPTLCGLIGADVPSSVEGRSMVKAMHDPAEKVRDSLFMGYEQFQRSIKDRQYKLIEVNADGQRNSQLFDVVNDPWELKNLFHDAEQQERVERMRKALIAWSKDWDDFESPWGKTFWSGIEFYNP